MVEHKVNVWDCPLFANTVRNRSCNKLLPTLTIVKASFRSQAYTVTFWWLWKLLFWNWWITLIWSVSNSCENHLSTMPYSDILLRRRKRIPRYVTVISLLYYIMLNHPLEGSSHPCMEIPLDRLETPSFISLILREDILTKFSGRITFS